MLRNQHSCSKHLFQLVHRVKAKLQLYMTFPQGRNECSDNNEMEYSES